MNQEQDSLLSGRRALVTGASSGLGEHFAQVLASRGAHVVLAARRVEALEECARNIGSQGGATVVALDVTDPTSIASALEQAGPVDILINNARIVRDGIAWSASTILSARRQLSWPVEAGEFIDGQGVLAVFF